MNPEINFNLLCKHFDSAPLGIGPLGDRIRTKFDMAVDLSGAKPDEISGYLVIDSLFLATSRDSILMEQMMLIAEAEKLGLDYVELKATDEGYGLYKKLGFEDTVSKYHNMKYIFGK